MSGKYSDEDRAKWRALGCSDAMIDEHEEYDRRFDEVLAWHEGLLRKAGFPEGLIHQIIEQRKESERLGIPQEYVDRVLDEIDCSYRADAILPGLLKNMVLRAHASDGWRTRFRLKRFIRRAGADQHLIGCEGCRLQLKVLMKKLHLIGKALATPPLP